MRFSRRIGLAMLTATAACFSVTSWAAERAVNETRPINATGKLLVNNVAGEIDVRGWDQPTMRITGTLHEDVESLDITGTAASMRVEVKMPQHDGQHQASANLLIMVPPGIHLNVQAVSANVRAIDLSGGDHQLKSVSGNIEARLGDGETLRLESVSGDINASSRATQQRIETVSGDIEVAGSSRETTLNSVSGDIEAAVGGTTRARTVSGDIELAAEQPLGEVTLETVSGDLGLRGALERDGVLSAESMSGDVRIQLTAAPASIRASTSSGRIRSELGDVQSPRFGPGSSLDYSGNGHGRVDLQSFSGNIGIRN